MITELAASDGVKTKLCFGRLTITMWSVGYVLCTVHTIR